jgi:predicted ArsR family transcriptional regulator
MHETRQRIVDALRVQGGQTIESLCAVLGLSRTAVKSHLMALGADGLVRRRGLQAGTRRPSNVYELTPGADRLFPKTYDDFAVALVEEIKRQRPDELKQFLDSVAARWIARDLPRVEGLHGSERLETVQRIMAERGFMPVLAQTAEGYELREHNCPLMRLTAEHIELCDMVLGWLEALFGTPLSRVRCLRLGDSFSAYGITPTARRGGSEHAHE